MLLRWRLSRKSYRKVQYGKDLNKYRIIFFLNYLTRFGTLLPTTAIPVPENCNCVQRIVLVPVLHGAAGHPDVTVQVVEVELRGVADLPPVVLVGVAAVDDHVAGH